LTSQTSGSQTSGSQSSGSQTSGRPEPIAIVGIGCRLPGGIQSPEDFWTLLREGREAIGEVPGDRWSLERHFNPDPQHPLTQHVRRGGFIDGIDQFDAAFFGISPREALCMDPQQRLLLGVAWRALEDGGVPAETLRGRSVGVFIGISSADYSSLLWASPQRYATPDNEPFVLPGNTGCIAANRLSYFFDFKGPSFTVDTACSSSLVAVHLACESLWRGESEAALAGGVQALIHPGIYMSFCKAGLLAADGRCKSFDASADGYVRSEGAGVVLLKPLAAAQAAGDPIYALIHGTAVNSDGRSNGMVAPNARAQMACVREAFARAAIDPAATQYVEAHGTGTRQGDPLELRALGTVLGEGRPDSLPCRVGSVKTNLGHAETAAGITSLIKAALAVHHRQLPPSLHFTNPNPAIDFEALKLQVQTRLEPFPQPDQPAVVGVSSFGFGGTNAHVVLADAPKRPPPPRYAAQLPLHPVCLSARTPEALKELAQAHLSQLKGAATLQLANLAASANSQRSHFRHRAVCLAADRRQLQEQLQALAEGRAATSLLQGQARQRPGKLAWLFTGQGSQSLGMARGLLEHQPVFQQAIERVAPLLDPHLSVPLIQLLRPGSGDEEALVTALNQTGTTQPVLFAVGYALAQLWLSWGVEPDLLLGHSVGEVVAAHLAGVFDLEDACRLITARGRLMQLLPAGGGMVAVLAPLERLQGWLEQRPALAVAALNGPTNTVISGPRADLDPVVSLAEQAGLACHPLAVSHAFHSPAMQPMLAAFERELRQLSFKLPRRALVSNLTGRLAGPEIATPDYWCDQVVSPVRFAEAVEVLVEQRATTLLEIGARPTLIGMARQVPQAAALRLLPSLTPGRPDLEVIFNGLAQLHCSGQPIDWARFHRPFSPRRERLPGYPFQRQRYWWSAAEQSPGPASVWLDQIGVTPRPAAPADTPANAPAGDTPAVAGSAGAGWAGAGPAGLVPATLQRLDLPGAERRYEIALSAAASADLTDHAIRGQAVFPAAGFLEQALSLLASEGEPLRLEAFRLNQPLRLERDGASTRLQLVWSPASRSLSFHSSRAAAEWLDHGDLSAGQPTPAALPWLPSDAPEQAAGLDLEAFYGALAAWGLEYGPAYRQLERLHCLGDRAWASLRRQHGGADRGLLDACFQAVAAALDPGAETGTLLLPVGLASLQFCTWTLPDCFACELQVRPSEEAAFVLADLVLHRDGELLGSIEGFRLRRLPRQALEWMFPRPEADQGSAGPIDLLVQSRWLPLAPAEPPTEQQLPSRPLLLAAPRAGLQLERWLADHGITLDRSAFAAAADIPSPDTLARADALLLWPDLADPAATAEGLCSVLLSLSQSLAETGATETMAEETGARVDPPRQLWLVLDPQAEDARQAQLAGALRGWWRTAALEQPQLNWTLLDLPGPGESPPRPADWPRLWAAAEREASLAWRAGELCGLRISPLRQERYRWASAAPGSLDALEARPMPLQAPAAGELEIAVEATGLNFRDVLNALGLLEAYSAELGLRDGSQLPFGGECVGRVVAVGPGVSPDRIGERVLAALAVGSLASHVRCRAQLCLPLPAQLSAELGASLSTAFLTAIHGLVNLAQLQPGETVLIHAAAGGVGQAALQVARRQGARIFATASQAKQAALLEQGVEAVFDSRSTAFAEQLLEASGGRGVDVVLNSLKGEWVDAGFRALAEGGRFVELGKLEIWSREQARERRPDARYLPFDLLEVAAAEPQRIRDLLAGLLADLQQGHYSPIPLQVFPEAQTAEAFRLMAQARHVGKLVISRGVQPAPLRLRPDATYLLTGGLGALGRQLVVWLVAQGARSLLLVSRSAQQIPADLLAQLPADVDCRLLPLELGAAAADAAADKAVERALAEAMAALPPDRPLRGLFHGAGVLDDGLIGGQTPERLRAVLAPKLQGWQQLERAVLLAAPPLQFAVAFSSMAALLGSPGQSNYGAANGALDGACAQAAGFGGTQAITLALQWGPWAGAGMASGQGRRLEALGVGLLPADQALAALGLALQRSRGGVLAVLANNWPQLARQAPPRLAAAMAELQGDRAGGDQAGGDQAGAGPPERSRLLALPVEERYSALLLLLLQRLALVMGLADPSSLDPADSLFQIGLDSLMAVELAAGVQQDLGVKLELESLAGDPSLESLAAILLRGLETAAGSSAEAVLDLAEEARLMQGWTLPPLPPAAAPGEAILLTGGSGFLGAYLLAGQLERWPALRLKVLVRAADAAQGADRLRRNLELYGLWQEGWGSRIEPIAGDLALPRFGLSEQVFATLAAGISGILHNGAQLSQLAPYSQLAAANVGGTRTVLELAALRRPLPVELISSVAVYEAKAYRDRELLETDDLAEWRGIHLGYSQTKWASERLVLAAGRAGLPVRTYRPPLIAGHSRSGLWHQDDLLHRLLRGCLELGQAPDIAWELDLVPVDYVADAVTAMAWQPPQAGRCLHLHHPEPLLLSDVLGGLIDRGAPLELVPMARWLEALERQPGNPLHPIRAFFSRRWGEDQLTYPELNRAGVRARPASALTVAALAERGVVCPRFEQLIDPYARTFLGSLTLG
jgi:myxalamid-type polyketide synthase MxaB